MDIGQVSAQSEAATQSSKSLTGNSSLDQDQFLELLVTQMQNQDPLNPMDGKQMASQLAQFNSVEQLIGVNDRLKQLSQSQQLMRSELTNSMASSLTGKEVRALGRKVNLEAGEDANINYDLSNAASEVEIVIRDSSGNAVRRETIEGAAKGENSWSWNGQSDDGVDVPDGQYEVEINAANGDESVNSRMFIEGIANKVRFTGEGVKISIDGVEVPIGDIETVAESEG